MQKNKAAHSNDDVQATDYLLTRRAELNLFVKYLLGIKLFRHMARMFGSMRESGKEVSTVELFKQILYFFLDDTNRFRMDSGFCIQKLSAKMNGFDMGYNGTLVPLLPAPTRTKRKTPASQNYFSAPRLAYI
jgi:hypothetical protein